MSYWVHSIVTSIVNNSMRCNYRLFSGIWLSLFHDYHQSIMIHNHHYALMEYSSNVPNPGNSYCGGWSGGVPVRKISEMFGFHLPGLRSWLWISKGLPVDQFWDSWICKRRYILMFFETCIYSCLTDIWIFCIQFSRYPNHLILYHRFLMYVTQ